MGSGCRLRAHDSPHRRRQRDSDEPEPAYFLFRAIASHPAAGASRAAWGSSDQSSVGFPRLTTKPRKIDDGNITEESQELLGQRSETMMKFRNALPPTNGFCAEKS